MDFYDLPQVKALFSADRRFGLKLYTMVNVSLADFVAALWVASPEFVCYRRGFCEICVQ